MTARGTRYLNPVQCHGLAGGIEFLIDMAQFTGDPGYLNEAQSLARLLETFARESDGLLVFPSERPPAVSPSYMTGYGGIAMCLLRLADPGARPHQLSRRGFRWREPVGVADPAAGGSARH
jgi:lantibiotic modifying enzyme